MIYFPFPDFSLRWTEKASVVQSSWSLRNCVVDSIRFCRWAATRMSTQPITRCLIKRTRSTCQPAARCFITSRIRRSIPQVQRQMSIAPKRKKQIRRENWKRAWKISCSWRTSKPSPKMTKCEWLIVVFDSNVQVQGRLWLRTRRMPRLALVESPKSNHRRSTISLTSSTRNPRQTAVRPSSINFWTTFELIFFLLFIIAVKLRLMNL